MSVRIGYVHEPLWVPQSEFVLHYAYMPGCAACAEMGPIVDKIAAAGDMRLVVRKYDITIPAVGFPTETETVPALVLELKGEGMIVRPSPKTMPEYGVVWRWIDQAAGELKQRRLRRVR